MKKALVVVLCTAAALAGLAAFCDGLLEQAEVELGNKEEVAA